MTLKRAVETVARQMDGARSLDSIMEEALQLAGRPRAKSTSATVRAALSRLPYIVRCGQGAYGPARVVLDQKALRVKLSPQDCRLARVAKARLEPFYSALESPPVETVDGHRIEPTYLEAEKMKGLQDRVLSALREAFGEAPPFEDHLAALDDEALLEEMDLTRVETGHLDLSPALDGWECDDNQAIDLVVRWDRGRDALVVAPQKRSTVDPRQIQAEDGLLADFVAAKLVAGNATPVDRLLLEALATNDALGRTPGSPVLEVISADPRMRLVGDATHGPRGVYVAQAGRLTIGERHAIFRDASSEWVADWRATVRDRILEHPRRFRDAWKQAETELGLVGDGLETGRSNVRLLRKPTNDELIREWHLELKGGRLSQRVVLRKVNHLRSFVRYLDTEGDGGPSHLLEVDAGTLKSFFFGTYIRRGLISKSNAETFPLDVRDFYRRQEELGRLADARFAELIYRMRGMIKERLELYNELLVCDEDFDELFEVLFFG